MLENSGIMLKILAVLIFSAIVLLQSCNSSGHDELFFGNTIRISATVSYISLEGGFWGLVSESGDKYQPVNLGKEFRKDGLKVEVRARVIEDTADFRMWGKRIEILEIEIAENQQSGKGNAE